LAKIATCKESLQTKKTYLQQFKTIFDFKSEQELATLYNSKKELTGRHFETFVLIELINGLGFGRKYELEAKLMEREEDKTLQFYSVEQFLEQDFFEGESDLMSKKIERFYSAIEFISKYLKKDPSPKNSDMIVCFLKAFNLNFPMQLKLKYHEKVKKQSSLILICFIKTVEMIILKQLTVDEYF
jgi:hypothetical protein